MKSIGIVRKLDELGRVTLPIELRRTLGIADRDLVEISVDGEKIILQKYIAPSCGCSICGRSDGVDIKNYDGRNVCHICAANIKKLFKL